MTVKKAEQFLYVSYFTAVAFIIVSIIPQLKNIIGIELSWHVYIAKSLEIGAGSLYKDFFDLNSPLVTHFASIGLLISKILYQPIILGLNIFHNLFAFLILGICLHLVRNSFDMGYRIFLIPALAYVIFLSPALAPTFEFGRKEHLFILLTLPYFLSVYGQDNIMPILRLVIGLMAGIGFCLMPLFLPYLLLVELYRYSKEIKILRLELISLVLFMILYLVHFLICYADDFLKLLPIWIEKYRYLHTCGIKCSLYGLVKNLHLEFIAAIISLIFLRKNAIYWLSLIALSLLFIVIQGQPMVYNYLTTLSFCIIAVALFLGDIYSDSSGKRKIAAFFVTALFLASMSKIMFVTLPAVSTKEVYNNRGYVEIINFMSKRPNSKIYIISDSPTPAFPILTAYQSEWLARQNSMELLEAFFKVKSYDVVFPKEALSYMISDAVGALKKKPDFVFVKKEKYLRGFFFHSAKFRHEWQHYTLVGKSKIGSEAFIVYEHKLKAKQNQ